MYSDNPIPALKCLNQIIERKIIKPEIYDIIDKVTESMIITMDQTK